MREPTHHVCRSVNKVVATRLITLKHVKADGTGGNHEDLAGKACYPEPPEWVIKNPKKFYVWWRRLRRDSILSPLRTTQNLDGASHGERIHYKQPRALSLRELLRVQGAPLASFLLIRRFTHRFLRSPKAAPTSPSSTSPMQRAMNRSRKPCASSATASLSLSPPLLAAPSKTSSARSSSTGSELAPRATCGTRSGSSAAASVCGRRPASSRLEGRRRSGKLGRSPTRLRRRPAR